jgi:hypothetical protein
MQAGRSTMLQPVTSVGSIHLDQSPIQAVVGAVNDVNVFRLFA